LVDLDGNRVQSLQDLIGQRSDVTILQGDCNEVLLQKILPKVRYSRRRRALCLLDPYGLDLDWKVISTAGKLGTVDMFLNFPIMDINRNALWTLS
jgi:three-Cys-motif partner protein